MIVNKKGDNFFYKERDFEKQKNSNIYYNFNINNYIINNIKKSNTKNDVSTDI